MSILQKKKDYLKKKIPNSQLDPWKNQIEILKTNCINYTFIRQILEQNIDNLTDDEINKRYEEKVRPIINKLNGIITELDI